MGTIDLNLIPARVLNYSSRLLLSRFLNPHQNLLSTEGYARDYRGLAEQMDFGYDDIRNFERSDNPTMKILDAWTVDPSATIGKIVSFLQNMGRHDVVQDISFRFVHDAKLYCKELERYKNSPLQVHEVTSCRTQDSQLDESNILTCEDINTGEFTAYDAYVSYADEDINFVYGLTRYLEASGFKLFIRSRDLLAGHCEYETNMQLMKDRCRRVLIVLSPDFINCPACEVQASFAASLGFDERRRKIVPIVWKPCEIPLILKYVAKIDFTKPDVQDWIWDRLKSSLRDVPFSVFVSSERRTLQGHAELPQIESYTSDASTPEITFPSTSSCALNSNVISSPCVPLAETSDEISNESLSTTVKKPTATPKQKIKKFWWQTKRVPKKNNSYSSVSSLGAVSSTSNATSGFHSQSGSQLESIDISAISLPQNTSM